MRRSAEKCGELPQTTSTRNAYEMTVVCNETQGTLRESKFTQTSHEISGKNRGERRGRNNNKMQEGRQILENWRTVSQENFEVEYFPENTDENSFTGRQTTKHNKQTKNKLQRKLN